MITDTGISSKYLSTPANKGYEEDSLHEYGRLYTDFFIYGIYNLNYIGFDLDDI